MSVLSIKGLHKEYGRITALNNLHLDIQKGSVFGLLGPNGSGKTTTLGMILGVINPTRGEYFWFGEKGNHHHRKRIGSILEKPNFYPRFSGYKNLQLACKIKRVQENRIDEVLEQVGLKGRGHDNFKTYSLGMKQRLAIASALLSHPEVMILDEPTNGLDPQGIAEIRQLITDIAQSGKTIILASHLLDEVQKICSEFAILKKGNLIHTGVVDADFGDGTTIEVATKDLRTLELIIAEHPGYVSHKTLKDRLELKCRTNTDAADIARFLADRDVYPHLLLVVKKKLEQQFMEILSQNV